MGTKAFLQKGRTRPGIVLPAGAVERVNMANDRSALERAAANEPTVPEVEAVISTSPDGEVVGVAVEAPVQPDPPPAPKPVLAAMGGSMSEAEVIPARLRSVAGIGVTGPKAEPAPIEVTPATAQEIQEAVGVTEEERQQAREILQEQGVGADRLTDLPGVGRLIEQRLNKYGYRTFQDIARADPIMLDQIPGSKGRGARWIEEARKRIG